MTNKELVYQIFCNIIEEKSSRNTRPLNTHLAEINGVVRSALIELQKEKRIEFHRGLNHVVINFPEK